MELIAVAEAGAAAAPTKKQTQAWRRLEPQEVAASERPAPLFGEKQTTTSVVDYGKQ
jgi:hypothetical protein